MSDISLSRVVDLTHLINAQTPVYPGTEPPTFEAASTLEKDGFRETKLSVWSHVGTHMDAPAHLLPGAHTLDQLPVGRFFGPAQLLDCRGLSESGISADIIRTLPLDRLDFVILRTGWEEYWGKDTYYGKFPTLSLEAAEILAASRVSGVAVDAISVDPIGPVLPVHRILFSADMIAIENLCCLNKLPENEIFSFCALPLNYENADGSPVRAAARF